MTRSSTAKATVRRVRGGETAEVEDVLAAEEPLEIRVVDWAGGASREQSLAVTMRTPGHDFDLAAGFLFTEGLVRDPEAIDRIEHVPPRSAQEEGNVVRVVLRKGTGIDPTHAMRAFYTTSACGVCGKSSLDAIRVRGIPPLGPGPQISGAALARLPPILRKEQSVFAATGGLHGTALFRADGSLASLREDVGRHNGVDKVVGERFRAGAIPLADTVMLVSGRAGFEIVQKALVAGVPILAAVGAPSSLAVDLATEFGMTLVGFLRGDAFNVYAGAERIV